LVLLAKGEIPHGGVPVYGSAQVDLFA